MVRRINLVPAGERRRTQTDLGLLAVVVVAMVAVGFMAMTYFSTSGQLSERDTQLAELQMQNQQLQSQLTSLAGYSTLEEADEAGPDRRAARLPATDLGIRGAGRYQPGRAGQRLVHKDSGQRTGHPRAGGSWRWAAGSAAVPAASAGLRRDRQPASSPSRHDLLLRGRVPLARAAAAGAFAEGDLPY